MNENIIPISLTNRTMGFKKTFGLWISANVVITTVLTGMLFASQITLLECVIAVLMGSLIGAIPLALTAKMGTRTGLSTMVISRGAFGQRGAVIPAIINAFMLIAWSWIQAYLAGISLNHTINYLFGYDNVNLFVILTELIVIVITIKGHKLIENIERHVANIMLIMSFIIFSVIFTQFNIQEIIAQTVIENPDISFIVAFDIVIATAFSWMSSVCDYNRHCHDEKSSMTGTYLGYTLATVIAMLLGYIVAIFSALNGGEATYDPTVLLSNAGFGMFGFVAAIVVFLSVVSTNIMGLYSATYSLMSIRSQLNYKAVTITLGIFVIIGSLFKEALMASFFDFILLVSTLFIPIFAIILTDFFVIKKGNYDNEEICTNESKTYNYCNGFNLLAIGSYILSAIFSYYFTYISSLPIGSSIPTMIFATTSYYILMKLFSDKNKSIGVLNDEL
ncbi:MAG: purine-cytosine permease family protein [Ostreibacterium sp.]